jgi:uncharacterized protein (UPF0335 family)
MPDGDVTEAVRVLRGRKAREAAAADPAQTDIEAATGVSDAQRRREAEASGIAADRLRSIVERIERLQEERKALGEDVKDIFGEAKSAGFDVKVLRRVLQLRKMEPAVVDEQDALLDLYRRALGM